MERVHKLTKGSHKAVGKMRTDVSPQPHGKRAKAPSATSRGRGGEISRTSIAAHALATFGSREKARHWMNRANALFGGRTPAEVLASDLVGVEAELLRIDHGVYM
jgi:uncharacterized protein (DUF2384 family)